MSDALGAALSFLVALGLIALLLPVKWGRVTRTWAEWEKAEKEKRAKR